MPTSSQATRTRAHRTRVLLAMGAGQSPERRAGIARYALEHGWIVDWRLAAFLVKGREREYLASSRIDGVISMMATDIPALQKMVSAATVPVVDMWHDYPELDCARVLLDQHAIGRAGAEHFIERGYRDLCFYSHTVDVRIARPRWEAFAQAAQEHNVLARELWWDPDQPIDEGKTRHDWLAEVLLTFPKPIGVMAVNDVVATEVLEAALAAGLKIPGDVAVLGADNDPILTELGALPLSSIDIARERVGYEAAALLDKLISGARCPKKALLIKPTGVVLRRSTEVFAVGDINLRKTAEFIRDHFREPIGVADVVAETYLGRRRLQDLFLATFVRSMNDEILRQRLDHSQHLLITTPHKVDRIAKMSGFGTGARMSKVFRRELGMTPQRYRQQHNSAQPYWSLPKLESDHP